MSKIKEFLGLDKDFKTHTEKKKQIDPVEVEYEATPAEIAAHNAIVLPPKARVATPDEVAKAEAAYQDKFGNKDVTLTVEVPPIPADEPATVISSGTEPEESKKYAVAGAGADPHDKKLDHFQYTKDPNQLDYWEFGEDVNTMSVPKNIRDKYPGMRFHWRSMARIDRLGMDYKGWQKFVDPTLGYAEGLKRGNDTMLFAMPEERAQRYNQKVAEDSTQRVRELQEHQMEMDDRATAAGLQPYEAKGKGTGGIAIGERAKGQSRGISREEVVERITKQQEARARGRVTFDMGRR